MNKVLGRGLELTHVSQSNHTSELEATLVSITSSFGLKTGKLLLVEDIGMHGDIH